MATQKRKISFSLPYISKNVIKEVMDVFNNTGWLTSGPKVIEFENELRKLNGSQSVICVNFNFCHVDVKVV